MRPIDQLFARVKALDTQVKYLLRSSAITFNLQILSNAMSLLFSWMLARWGGTAGVGIYFQCLTIVTLAGTLSHFGLQNAMLRFAASSHADKDWDALAGLSREGNRLVVLFSIPIILIIFVLASWIANGLYSDEDIVVPLRIMSLGILPQGLSFVNASLLRGMEKFVASSFSNALGLPLFNSGVYFLVGRHMGNSGIALSFVIASTLTLLVGLSFWWRATPELRYRRGHFDRKMLISTSRPLFWIDLGNVLGSWLDMLILGVWLDTREVGIYGVAKRIARLISFLLKAINFAVAPRFSSLFAQNNMVSLEKLARNSATLATLLVLPVALTIMFFPVQILGLYGEGFKAGATALMIVAIGQVVNASTGSVGYLLIMTGHERDMRSNSILGIVVSVVLLNLLIPFSGIVGAAIASTIATVMVNVIAVILVYWRLHFVPIPLPDKLFLRHGS